MLIPCLSLLGACTWWNGLFKSKGSQPPAPKAELVVFCADNDPLKNPGLNGVADALNSALKGRFGGNDARVSPVHIADARAVVEECNVPGATTRCWAALAQLNHAAQVVVPDLSGDAGRAVSVVLTVYDAAHEKVLRTSQRTFKSAAEAQSGVAELVAQIAAPGSGG